MAELRIELPPPNTRGFQRGFARISRILRQTREQLLGVDQASRRTGRGFGRGFRGRGGAGARAAGAGRLGGPPARRRGVFGGQAGVSGGAANIARAAGIAGVAATAVGSTAAVATAIALAAAIKESLEAFGEFEEKLGEIGRVAGLSGKRLEAFGEGVLAVSREVPVATSRILALASAGANAGLRADELGAFTEEMSKLAALIPELDASQARGILRVAQLTKFPVEEIGRLNSAILNLQQTTKVTFAELVTITQRVGQDLGIFGVATEDVLTFGAAIKDLGLQPERASTALQRTFGQLKNIQSLGRETAASVVATFGRTSRTVDEFIQIAAKDPAAAFRIVAEESNNYRKALEDLSVTGKQSTLTQALLLQGERLGEIRKEAEKGIKGSIIDKQLTGRVKELTAEWQLFKNTVFETAKTLGAILAPVAKRILQLLQEAASAVGGFLAGIRELAAFEFKKVRKRLSGELEAENREKALAKVAAAEKRINDLRKQGVQAILAAQRAGNIGLAEREVKALDDRIKDIKTVVTDDIRGLIPFREIQLLTKDFKTLTGDADLLINGVNVRLKQAFFSAAEAVRALGADLGRSTEKLKELKLEIDNLEFELRISDLDELDQGIQRTLRKTTERFQKLLGDQILRPGQIDALNQQLRQRLQFLVDPGESIDFLISDDPFETVRRISEELDKLRGAGVIDKDSILAFQQALTIAERLSTSQENVQALRRIRNLELDKLLKDELKNIEQERKNIANKSAPQIEAILDTGAVVELLNQRQLDNQLQQEELQELERIRQAVEQQVALEKRKNLRTLDRPPGT